jgi:hypothetical protein
LTRKRWTRQNGYGALKPSSIAGFTRRTSSCPAILQPEERGRDFASGTAFSRLSRGERARDWRYSARTSFCTRRSSLKGGLRSGVAVSCGLVAAACVATAAAVVATPVARGDDSPPALLTATTTASAVTTPSPEPAPAPSPDPAPAPAKPKPPAPRQTTTHAATATPAPVVSARSTVQTKTKTVTRVRPPHVAKGHVRSNARRGGVKHKRATPVPPLRTQAAPPPSQTLHREGAAPSMTLVSLGSSRPARLSVLVPALIAAAGLLVLLAVLSRRPVVARHFSVARHGSGDAAFVLAGFGVAILIGLFATLVGAR